MEHRPHTASRQLGMGILRAFQDKGVMPIGVKPVPTRQPLIHQQRQAEFNRCVQRCVQRRVFVSAHGMMHPIQDQLTGDGQRTLDDWV